MAPDAEVVPHGDAGVLQRVDGDPVEEPGDVADGERGPLVGADRVSPPQDSIQDAERVGQPHVHPVQPSRPFPHGRLTVGADARIDASQPVDAADQQARHGQQHHRHRGLPDHETGPQACVTARSGLAASAFLELRVQVGSEHARDRNQTYGESGCDGDRRRDGEDSSVQ